MMNLVLGKKLTHVAMAACGAAASRKVAGKGCTQYDTRRNRPDTVYSRQPLKQRDILTHLFLYCPSAAALLPISLLMLPLLLALL